MGKKKKTYKVSSKPKVAAMNEYIYNTLKDDLAKEYTANKPRKPKAVYKTQVAKRTNLKIMQGEPERYKPKPKVKTFREAGSKYGTGFKSKGGRPLPASTSFTKIDSRKTTKILKQAGYLTESALGGEGISKAKFGIPKGKNPTIKKGVKKTVGDVVGYKTAKSAESTLDVAQQRLGGTQFKPSSKKVTIYDTDTKKRKVPGSKYVGGNQPLYKSGTSSPLNKKVIQKASKPLSHTAKKAVLARGAKLAAKGATRLIPGVGTAMLAKDVYNVLTKSEATKYVPQFGAKNVSKKYKKGKNY